MTDIGNWIPALQSETLKRALAQGGHFLSPAIGVSTRLCPLNSLLPIRVVIARPHIIIGRAIQWIKPSSVAGLICGVAAPFDARMTAERAALKHRWKGTKRAVN